MGNARMRECKIYLEGEAVPSRYAISVLRLPEIQARPLFWLLKKKHGIENITLKGQVLFKKTDVFEQLSFSMADIVPELDLTVLTDFAVEKLEVAPDMFDLRLIRSIDAFGAICLMCCLKSVDGSVKM